MDTAWPGIQLTAIFLLPCLQPEACIAIDSRAGAFEALFFYFFSSIFGDCHRSLGLIDTIPDFEDLSAWC
jgi:hypothetical protein